MAAKRFDLIAGIYAYCVLNHGGQGSRLYRTLSLIERTCSPRNVPVERIADGYVIPEWRRAHEAYARMATSGY